MNLAEYRKCRERVIALHAKVIERDQRVENEQKQQQQRLGWLITTISSFIWKPEVKVAPLELERDTSLIIEDLFGLSNDCNELSNGDFSRMKNEIWMAAQREEKRENIAVEEIFENEDLCARYYRWNGGRLQQMLMRYSTQVPLYYQSERGPSD